MTNQNNKKVSVITGGGSGMGLAAAKVLGKEHYIIIVGRTLAKLETALQELRSDGIECESFSCDIADYNSANKLAQYSKTIGEIAAVIHSAGMSPNMGDAKKIMEANAIGTININNAFYEVLKEGSCIVDISSMSGYMAPKIVLPIKSYKYCRISMDKFMNKMMSRINLFPKKLRSQLAYVISKNFVTWYAITDAARFGLKGIRVISVSPGTFETPMGELEKENADAHLRYCAIKRPGKVDEIAHLLAFIASEKAGYLTGLDIICDGGCIAGKNYKI